MGLARVAALTGVLGAGVLVMSACGVSLNSHQYEDDNTVGQHISKVIVNGADSLHVHVGGGTSVHRKVNYAENDPGKNTWRVEGGDTLILEDCHHDDCSVGYDVTVPEGSTITGEVGSGDVELDGLAQVNFKAHSGDAIVRGVSGSVNLAADSGSVTIEDVGGAVSVAADSGDVILNDLRGAVTAKAGSGDVTAKGVGGAAKVESDSGDITVAMASAQDVTAKASSGGVAVAVPRQAYRVRTDTGSGDVTSDVPNDSAGQYLLDLQASSGDISIRYA